MVLVALDWQKNNPVQWWSGSEKFYVQFPTRFTPIRVGSDQLVDRLLGSEKDRLRLKSSSKLLLSLL